MAGGFGFSDGTAGDKTTAQKQKSAGQQLKSSLERLSTRSGQNATLQSFGNAAHSFGEQFDKHIANPLEDVGGSILNILNRPSQAVLRGIQAEQTGTNILAGMHRGFWGPMDDHQINFRAALNTDNWQAGKGYISPEAEHAAENQSFIADDKQVNPVLRELDKLLAGAVDTGATGVTDPTSYIPAGAIGNAAKAVGLTKAADKIAATKVGQAVADKLDVAAQTKRELGNTVSENVTQAVAGMRGGNAQKVMDIQHQFQNIEKSVAKSGVDPAKFNREVATPALESGNWQEVSQQLRDAGRVHEARYLDAQHALRQKLTDIQVDNGSLKNPLPVDKYMYHAATPEYQKFLQSLPPAEAEAGFNYKPQTPGALIGEQYGRRFMPGATIAEKNAAVFAKSGGKVTKAFEDNSAKALGIKARQVLENDSRIGLINHLSALTDAAGNPLVHHIPDVRSQLRDAATAAREATSAVHGQYKRVPDRAVSDAQTTVNKLSRTVDRLRASSSEATAARADAAKAGVPNVAPQAAMLDRLFEYKQLVDDLAADPTVDETVLSDARESLQHAKDALTQEKGTAKAAATGKRVQQTIGSTRTAASYESKLLQTAEAELQRHQQILDKAAAKDQIRKQFNATKQELLNSQKIERPPGYAKVNLGPVGHAYMQRSVASRLESLAKHEPTGGLEHAMGVGTQVMKNLLLNPAPFAIARTTRDLFPNIVNMAAKGFRNPHSFVEAGKVQRMLDKSLKAGLTHDEAIAKLPAKYRTLEEEISKRGVVNSGQIRSDVSHGIGLGESKSAGSKLKQALDVRNAEGILTRHGAALNTAADDLSRRAMFYDQMAQHGNATKAAQATRDALFDFADLTDTEKRLRKYIVFWTWTARNAKLQAWTLAHAPQVPLNVGRAQRNAQGTDTGSTLVPGYSLNSREVPLFKVGGNAVLGTIQSPFDAAAQSIQPLVDIASYFGPNKYTTQQGLRGGLAGLSSNIGGLPGTLGKTAVEQATGINLFTGAPIKGTKAEVIKQALLNTAPRGTQYNSIGTSLKSGTDAERVAALMKLLGVTTTVASPKTSLSETYRRNRAVEDAANQQGIPTVTELKHTGKFKPASKK